MTKIKQKHHKEIISLSTFEAVRMRPTMYVGHVSLLDDRLPVIENSKLVSKDKSWSPGFMHLLVEIFENSIDEAKRCKGRMKNISVKINIDTNRVTITDEGDGFYDAHKTHERSGKNVVRTAFEDLHAGSNFIETEDSILGTNGVGSAVCNILSEEFSVKTVNNTHCVSYTWKDFQVLSEEIRKKRKNDKTGTSVSFIPSKEIFGTMKWDLELVKTYFSFRSLLIELDTQIKDLRITYSFIQDSKENIVEVTQDFLPADSLQINTKLGTIFLWPKYEGSTSVSFVNGSQCTGIHQKIINDWLNEHFGYNLAHHFYDTFVTLNVPSRLMKFADQNKTKYAMSRNEIEEEMETSFRNKLLRLVKRSDMEERIINLIEERFKEENIRKIKRAQKTSKRKISEKYTPPTRIKDTLYITEGLSASGSVRQARDPHTEGVYALKGKVKNVKRLSDLASNNEIVEILSVLGLVPGEKKPPVYHKIVITSDNDFDGAHISSLLINLFYRWFPYLIEEGHVYMFILPIVSAKKGKEKTYYHTVEEFMKDQKTSKLSGVNYLKGLGSLSMDDWEWVMNNKKFFKIKSDRSAKRYMDIAFGDSSKKRKKWLQGKTTV